jgi:hypothetical protein
MPTVDAGDEKYSDGDRVPMTASAAVSAGEPVTVTGPEQVGPTDGANGFVGVAGADADADEDLPVQFGGVVPAAVTTGVTAGTALAPASDGSVALTGDGTPAAGDTVALTDAQDGVALVHLS